MFFSASSFKSKMELINYKLIKSGLVCRYFVKNQHPAIIQQMYQQKQRSTGYPALFPCPIFGILLALANTPQSYHRCISRVEINRISGPFLISDFRYPASTDQHPAIIQQMYQKKQISTGYSALFSYPISSILLALANTQQS